MARLDLLDKWRDEDYELHAGYRDGEVPKYGTCACGLTVRLDRLDLLREHSAVCTHEIQAADAA